MDTKTFDAFRRIVVQNSGIWLKDGKETMLCARVSKRMRILGIEEYAQYLQRVEADHSGEEVAELLDVVATNVTSFFREAKHFEFLTQTVQRWMARGQRRFRFWSAGCSSGEEPYSMAMTLLETMRDEMADVRILATDISRTVLRRCQEGLYDEERLRHVAPILLQQHFLPVMLEGRKVYCVKKAVREWVTFRRLNLAETSWPMRGPFDIVFCRNVMIYFDEKVRRALLQSMHRLLKPGGYLIVGHAESLNGFGSEFKAVVPSIYTKTAVSAREDEGASFLDLKEAVAC